MRAWVGVVVLGGSLAGAALADPYVAAPLTPIARSVSLSQQFVIYYRDKLVRAELARKVEDLKSHWLERLGLKDDWQAPIIVQLHTIRPAGAPPISTGFYESDDNQLKIQIDVNEPAVLAKPEFAIEIYRALCLEYAYRKTPVKAGKNFTQPPDWLLQGLYEDGWARDNGIPADIYATLIERGSPPRLAEFLKIDAGDLDSTSLAVYRAQAMGLLRAFLTFEGGDKALNAYLAKLPSSDPGDPRALLAAFPSLTKDPTRLAKIWTLSMAEASAANRIEPLSVPETKRQLDALLDVTAPGPPTPPKAPPKPKDPKSKTARTAPTPVPAVARGAAALPALARSKGGSYLMRQKAADLLRLEVQAHPLLRPIVQEYRSIVTELSLKPKKNLTARIAKNDELLNGIMSKMDQVTDYVNWYEATQINTPSGQFTAAVADSEEAQPPPRPDAISRALDDVEARGW